MDGVADTVADVVVEQADPDALQRFASAADALNFVPLDMEIATNGVRLSH